MPRLSRKNIRKRKSYRKQIKRNRKVRKSLKGGNLTPEAKPLSSSEMNLCPNFENIQELDLRNIYAKKNGQEHDCDELYYRKPDDIFYPISNEGKFASYTADSQNPEDYMSIVESVLGEVSIPKNTRAQTRSRKKSKVKPQKKKSKVKPQKTGTYATNDVIISVFDERGVNQLKDLEKQPSCKSLRISKAEKKKLKDHYFDHSTNPHKKDIKKRTNFDENICHLYYKPMLGYQKKRGYGYLKEGSVREIKDSIQHKKNDDRQKAQKEEEERQARRNAQLKQDARIFNNKRKLNAVGHGSIVYDNTAGPSVSLQPQPNPDLYSTPNKPSDSVIYAILQGQQPPSIDTGSVVYEDMSHLGQQTPGNNERVTYADMSHLSQQTPGTVQPGQETLYTKLEFPGTTEA